MNLRRLIVGQLEDLYVTILAYANTIGEVPIFPDGICLYLTNGLAQKQLYVFTSIQFLAGFMVLFQFAGIIQLKR